MWQVLDIRAREERWVERRASEALARPPLRNGRGSRGQIG